MAWEEESIESGADFEEVGGKKSIVKILMIVVVLAVLGAGGFFAYKHFTSKPDEEAAEGETKAGETKSSDNKAEQADEGEAGEGEGVPAANGLPVPLEKFTINLVGASTHYLVTTVVLEVSDLKLKSELQNPDSIYMSRTRATINEILRAKTYDEMRDPNSSKEVAKEIKFKLNRFYAKDLGQVQNVFFSEFLVD